MIKENFLTLPYPGTEVWVNAEEVGQKTLYLIETVLSEYYLCSDSS